MRKFTIMVLALVCCLFGLASPALAGSGEKHCSDVWCKSKVTVASDECCDPTLNCWVTPERPIRAATVPVTVRGSGPAQCNMVPKDFEFTKWQVQYSLYANGPWSNLGAPVTSSVRSTWIYKTDSAECHPGTVRWYRTWQTVDIIGTAGDDSFTSDSVKITC